MRFFSLPDRGLIRLSGPDALGFLQNLLTQDLRPLRDWEGAPALLLEAGGKIRFDMYVLRREPQIYMVDCALTDLRPLGRALSAARVAERFSLEVEPEWHVVGFLARPADSLQMPENSEEQPEKTQTQAFQKVTDTRHPKLGWRLYGSGSPKQEPNRHEALSSEASEAPASPEAARMNFLPYGIVEGGAALAGRWPLVAGLDRLNYISWTKGCFPGHEVTARVHYKGKPKYAFRLFKAEQALPALPEPSQSLAAAKKGTTSSPKGPPLLTRQRRPIGDYICHQDTYLIAQVLRTQAFAGTSVAGEQTDQAAKPAASSAPSENELFFQDHILRPWPVL